MSAISARALSLTQLQAVRDVLATQPHGRGYEWQTDRDVALFWYIVSLGTRSGETSRVLISHVYTAAGGVRDVIPCLGGLQITNIRPPGFVLLDVTAELKAALDAWHLAYTKVMDATPEPTMPLWLSRVHTSQMRGITREQAWRIIKAAARTCGLNWVTLDGLRITTAVLRCLDRVSADSVRALVELQEALRQRHTHNALAMVARQYGIKF